MRERLPAILALLTTIPVGCRAAASFVRRHYSPEWEFAQGQWFLHSYDAVYTYGPLLTLALVAWGFHRRSSALIAYGLCLLLVILVGPLIVSLRTFPDHPVLSSWLADPSFISATVLAAGGAPCGRPHEAQVWQRRRLTSGCS